MYNLSYWEREYKKHYDFIIIGAGIVGLTTAINIKKNSPKSSVLIVEQGIIPMGATTKNAGFACVGSASEIMADMRVIGEENAIQQVKNRYEGLQELLKLVNKKEIQFKDKGNYEILTKNNMDVMDHLSYLNSQLKDIFNENIFTEVSIQNCFTHKVKNVILNKFEGELNSALLHCQLSDLAVSLGIEFKYGTKVLSIDEEVNTETYSFKFGKVAVCSNAYTSLLLPEYNIKSGRGQVLIYNGIELRDLDAPCHYDAGFYYFRPIEHNRLLIGGGRNINFNAETTTHLINSNEIVNGIKEAIHQLFTTIHSNSRVEYSWAGVMGFSPNKKPIIENVPNRKNVFIGFACNGMGVALGAKAGKDLARIMNE